MFFILPEAKEINGRPHYPHLFEDDKWCKCPVPLIWTYPLGKTVFCFSSYEEWFDDIKKRQSNLDWLIEYYISKTQNISLEEAKKVCLITPDLQLVVMDDCMNNSHFPYNAKL